MRLVRGLGLYLLVFAFVGGILVYEYFYKKPTITDLDAFVETKITLTGVLVEEQEKREFNTRLTIQIQEIGDQKITEPVKVLVTTSSPKEYVYGDVVSVKGKFVKPENFYTDTGREFDYVGYLEANEIRFLIKNASVQKIGYDPPSKVISGLFVIKRAFVNSLKKGFTGATKLTCCWDFD